MLRIESTTIRLLAGAALAVALAGCGGDDDATADADPVVAEDGTLVVIALDIDFPTDRYEAEAGPLDIRYENEGRIVHTLVIEGVDGFALTVAGTGDVDEGSVDLAPGEYELYCDVAGHRGAGMEATLLIS